MPALFIGLMSGTSLDGVDGVLADLPDDPTPPQVLAHAHRPIDATLKAELLALNSPTTNEIERAALAGNALARLYAEVVTDLLHGADVRRDAVRAIAAHGQTVRHRPVVDGGPGYSVQLNNPALLAELCGIDVIADLRARDVAAGGQGAPLAPAFHRVAFARRGERVAVLNLGGISNLSVLDDNATLGFDCGPANALLDHWCQQHTGRAYDDRGAWAAGGRVLPSLLAALGREPYLALAPPKSTGRDLFNPAWLEARLNEASIGAAPAVDVQATLAEFSARCIADAGRVHAAGAGEVIVCGGGVHNLDLLQRLARAWPGIAIHSSAARGVPPEQVEATCFAWLARRFIDRQPGNVPGVTGAAGPRVLGALYPAS